jgi:hypothetical protein
MVVANLNSAPRGHEQSPIDVNRVRRGVRDIGAFELRRCRGECTANRTQDARAEFGGQSSCVGRNTSDPRGIDRRLTAGERACSSAEGFYIALVVQVVEELLHWDIAAGA